MKVLLLSSSLNDQSRSRTLAQRARETLAAAGADICFVDLQKLDLPLCGADACYDHPQVVELARRLEDAEAILISTPVYNFAVSAACKNVIELTGSAWEGKVVGFMCAAGGQGAFMAVMPLANSLMLDYRCLIVPRFVYVTSASFQEGELADPEVERRVAQLCEELMRIAGALNPER